MFNNKITKQTEQVFIDSNNQHWQELKDFPDAQILPLAVQPFQREHKHY
ncbi:hypothetical protein [Dulcicalothrix desertica]|nr:hypothetical protein [Dulcicalothrix desertica]TWH53510.1 hypothetical protein CAL7102_01465 [Dulcicalothrix desertica PCC 7102]